MTINEAFHDLFYSDIEVYNEKTRTVFFADITEDSIYGLNYYKFNEDCDLDTIKEEFGSLREYCVECIPAAGTGCPDRLGWIPLEYINYDVLRIIVGDEED